MVAMNLDCGMALLSLVLDGASTAFCQVACPVLFFRLTYDLQLVAANLVWERHTQRRLANIADASDASLCTSTATGAGSCRDCPPASPTACYLYHWWHHTATRTQQSSIHPQTTTGQLSLLFYMGREMRTGQSAVMLRGWGIKAR